MLVRLFFPLKNLLPVLQLVSPTLHIVHRMPYASFLAFHIIVNEDYYCSKAFLAMVDLTDDLALSLHAPSWEEEDERDGTGAFDRRSSCSVQQGSRENACLLEGFSEDISALIISHLDLQEIADLSYVSKSLRKACRSNTLWRYLMHFRWNLEPEEHSFPNYFLAYQQAHSHPHDLWLSHWNITFPTDALAPGRCFIPTDHSDRSSAATGNHTEKKGAENHVSQRECCPSCRNWGIYDEERNQADFPAPQTTAQAMALATSFTRQKCLHRQDTIGGPRPSAARQAFSCAGTFNRQIKTQQYHPGSTNFLTDLLFFNLTDPCTEEGQWELQQLLREAQTRQEHEEATSGDHDHHEDYADPLHETSHHSWHVCRLFNPDFYRSVIYQVGVQRPDCFSFYPSEGYIPPGGSMFVTIGIRPLGSALAYAFDALNVQRDGLDVEWAELYTTQAHLPMAPILLRYQFAATHPAAPDSMYDPRKRPPRHVEEEALLRRNGNKDDGTDKESLLDYHWRQPVAPHHVRSMRLSVHVHSHYLFNDFLKATCQPWRKEHCSGPLFVAPNLSERFPRVFQKLDNPVLLVDRRGGSLTAHPSLADGPCIECNQRWGTREEELAQAFTLSLGEVSYHQSRRMILLKNIFRCLSLLTRKSDFVAKADIVSVLLVTINRILQCFKASPWMTVQQKLDVIRLETIVDNIYQQLPVGGEEWVPWRLAGVYRYAVCTDSVFHGPRLDQNAEEGDFQDEPEYLDAFRHLAHNPGYYCLGPQEDPNHPEETIVKSSPRYSRTQKGISNDLFMGQISSSSVAGFVLIRNPRSLLVHGIYDRIPYPGYVVRRPKVKVLLTNQPIHSSASVSSSNSTQSMFSLSDARRSYCLLQNALDIDAIISAEKELASTYYIPPTGLPKLLHLSVANYVCNVPPPGVGRFAISQEAPRNSALGRLDGSSIAPLSLFRDTPEPRISEHGQNNAAVWRQPNPVFPNRIPPPPPPGIGRGPRVIHLLWALGARLGLAVIDSPDVASVFVDRTILIASQWVSISLMLAPLFWTLCARCIHLIPAQPIEYNLENLPFHLSNKMRFLTEEECGFCALLVFFVWLALGRWSERNIERNFFRVMLEHVSPQSARNSGQKSRLERFRERLFLGYNRKWDAICPLFLQRRVFAPHWNRRTTDDLMKHIAFWRSRNLVEQRAAARPVDKRSDRMFGDRRDEGCEFASDCTTTKLVTGTVVALGSFCSSSPHFWLNLVTVFSCSISLGMSVSLHSMEKGRSSVNTSSTGSMIKAASLATVVIMAFLLGQLVGSSGGTMFLAEFIVTSISLILGGAGVSCMQFEDYLCSRF